MAFKFLSYFINYIFIASAWAVPDADGWVSLRPPERAIEETVEDSDGTWAVFSKEMGGEKFFVRFPGDPSYRYLPNGMTVEAGQDGDSFLLLVQERADRDLAAYFDQKKKEIEADPEMFLVKSQEVEGEGFEMLYRFHDRWVWERVVETPGFFYSFHTESDQMAGNWHRKFVSSFTVSPM